MGNHHGHQKSTRVNNNNTPTDSQAEVRRTASIGNPTCLIKLFEKLELQADEGNHHPGELTRVTFENAFRGPLDKFGKLLYRQMCNGNGVRDRITSDQFVKAGKKLLQLFEESDQHKYYFKLFAAGKDYLNKEDALQMVNIAYALTLSASMIPYSKNEADERVFAAMAESMFGMQCKLLYEDFAKWMAIHCPHMFCGVHNWVYTILTGSKMPSEQETAPVPQLERFVEGKYLLSMGMLWMLSATIPSSYTHTGEAESPNQENPTGMRNPLLTSFHLLMKLARLTRCQSWTLLYDSSDHGLSLNRFTHHVSSYSGPSISLFSFEGRNVYCVAEDRGWREGLCRFGADDTVLIQISPVYRVVQAGGPMVIWNDSSREIKRGIHVGKDGKSVVLFVPQDFDRVEHYGVTCALSKIEVWGCGCAQLKEQQIKQKLWERKQVDKVHSQKLRLDAGKWDENPDKQLLKWGGVEVNHQYSRQGGF